jgi:hypothetical protein
VAAALSGGVDLWAAKGVNGPPQGVGSLRSSRASIVGGRGGSRLRAAAQSEGGGTGAAWRTFLATTQSLESLVGSPFLQENLQRAQ